MVYIPEGLAHGMQTLESESELFYMMSEFYAPEAAAGVHWDDPAFAVSWPAAPTAGQIIAAKDQEWPELHGQGSPAHGRQRLHWPPRHCAAAGPRLPGVRAGWRRGLRPASRRCPVFVAQADLLIPGQVEPLLAAHAPTHLLHFAWNVETGKFWSAPANLEWVEASLRLVYAFAACGGQRLVMVGTCAGVADWSGSACCSPETPLRPATLYGAAKLAVWLTVKRFAASRGLSAAWGRIFSPYGPDEHPARLVAATIRSMLR